MVHRFENIPTFQITVDILLKIVSLFPRHCFLKTVQYVKLVCLFTMWHVIQPFHKLDFLEQFPIVLPKTTMKDLVL